MNTHLSLDQLQKPSAQHISYYKEKKQALKWLSNLQGKEYNEVMCHQLSDGVVFLQVKMIIISNCCIIIIIIIIIIKRKICLLNYIFNILFFFFLYN